MSYQKAFWNHSETSFNERFSIDNQIFLLSLTLNFFFFLINWRNRYSKEWKAFIFDNITNCWNLVFPRLISEKLKCGLKNFFQGKEFFLTLIRIKGVKIRLRKITKKTCSPVSGIVSQNFDFTVSSLHRDYPIAWELIKNSNSKKNLPQRDQWL